MIHNADTVRHAERLFLVVRDQDRADPDLALDLADRAAQVLADASIQRAERFVEEEYARFVRERASDSNALLLAAGQLRRQPLFEAFQRHEPQQLIAAALARGRRHAARTQGELDVVRHRHVPEQRVVLEHETDLAQPRIEAGHVLAVQDDSAAIHRRQARDCAQERALAAAGRSQQDEELALFDIH